MIYSPNEYVVVVMCVYRISEEQVLNGGSLFAHYYRAVVLTDGDLS